MFKIISENLVRFYLLPFLIILWAPVTLAQSTPVTVTILRFIQGQDPDPVQVVDAINNPDTIGHGDYYAEVRIGSNPFERNRSKFIESTDFQPFWSFSRTIDDDGIIPVVIRIWDADPIENNDDIIDLNPQDNVQELVLNLDLDECTWTGDVELNGMRSRGDGDKGHTGVLEGGERGTVLFDIACSQTGDIDKDGIPDGVERFGVFDADGNQVSNLMGQADPCRPNIVVEIDFMGGAAVGHNHRPNAAALTEIRAAFNNAGFVIPTLSPSECPYAGFPTQTGGGIGMILMVDDQIPEQSPIRREDLASIRNANFDSELKPYVHYNLWAHNITFNGSIGASGVCCTDRKDFIVSLGSFPGQNGSVRQQSGTFMHELGHSLGLNHWGGNGIDLDQNGNPIDDGRNCKPNYLSVMNYFFQTVGITDNNTGVQAIDYSRNVLPSLNESALSEQAGIGDGTLVTAWCDLTGARNTGQGDSALDWNSSTFIDFGTTVSVDIAAESGNRGSCCRNSSGITASPGETLSGFNDWRNIEFRAVMAPGSGTKNEVFEDELTANNAAEIEEFWEKHLRCFPPNSGEWIIDKNCTIWRDVTAPGDLIVENGIILKIGSGVSLDVDFIAHSLRVKPDARIEVLPGGRIE